MRPEDKKTTDRNQENRNPSQQQNRDRERTGYDAKKDVKGAQVRGSEQRGQERSQGREKDFAKDQRDQSKGNRPFNK